MTQECCFCKELISPLNSVFYKNIGCKFNINSRMLFSTKNWYAIPSLGCLSPGHILIVCKLHYLCSANLTNQLRQELLRLKNKVEKILLKKTGEKSICFEHGVTSDSFVGANSIDHVHLHIIPLSYPIWPQISSKYNFHDFEIIPDYKHLFKRWDTNLPNTYLLFQDTNNIIYYNENGDKYPSQLFRKCIAPFLNSKQWDWKKEYYEENLIKTLKLFK